MRSAERPWTPLQDAGDTSGAPPSGFEAYLLDQVQMAVIVTDLGGRVTFWNKHAESLYGWTREEALGSHVTSLTVPAGREGESEAILRQVISGSPWEGEFPVLRKDGATLPTFVTLSPLHDAAGELVAIAGVSVDLTERRQHDEERARLLELERKAREEAESAQRRLAFLAEASAVLVSSLDYMKTLARLADVVVPRMADWCSVDIVTETGAIRQLAVAHQDPAKVKLAKELRRRYPLDPQAERGVPRVIATGISELYPEVPEELLEASARDDEHLAIMRGLGLRSAMTVPLTSRRGTLGAITLVLSESDRRYGHDDLALAEELARRAGLAVENARLYQERTHVARTLQRSLLPPELPTIPGIDLAARYRAAGEGNEVGGDFYDVFDTGDGSWAVVIGDVCGKGAEAAVVTALARHTLRAAAIHETKPSSALEVLNSALLSSQPDQRFCTVCYLRLRPDGDRTRITVCCGGHPVPLIVRADGTLEEAGVPGTLLGVFPDVDLRDRASDLGPGDAVVLFTDGVTEEHTGGRIFGEERLARLLTSMAGLSAHAMAEKLERAVEEFASEDPRDDVAIVVLRVLPRPAPEMDIMER